jgi:CrcB protein
MTIYLLIALGGALGSVVRYALNNLIEQQLSGSAFPWGTLVINVTGSLLIGLFSTLTGPDGRWVVANEGRLFFMTGVCGGYTTFSAFSLQTLSLIRLGDWQRAAAYIAASVILCLVAVWVGHALATTS